MIFSRFLLRSRIHDIRDEPACQEAASAATPHSTSGSRRSSNYRIKFLMLQRNEGEGRCIIEEEMGGQKKDKAKLVTMIERPLTCA